MRIINRRRFQNIVRVVIVIGVAWLLCHLHPMTTRWDKVQSGPPNESGQWRIAEVVATPWSGICQIEWQPVADFPVYCPRWAYVRNVPQKMVDRHESMAETVFTGQAVWANTWLMLVFGWLLFLDIRSLILQRAWTKNGHRQLHHSSGATSA